MIEKFKKNNLEQAPQKHSNAVCQLRALQIPCDISESVIVIKCNVIKMSLTVPRTAVLLNINSIIISQNNQSFSDTSHVDYTKILFLSTVSELFY